jgi:hypothetical protein
MSKDMSLYYDEIERAVASKEFNKNEHRRYIKHLLSHAEKGNWAWVILENEYGFDGDYQPSDWGEPVGY